MQNNKHKCKVKKTVSSDKKMDGKWKIKKIYIYRQYMYKQKGKKKIILKRDKNIYTK